MANAYVKGNVFVYSKIGTNNVDLAGGTDTTPISDRTTGILIWSDATPTRSLSLTTRLSTMDTSCG
jgi:hypothetical protein